MQYLAQVNHSRIKCALNDKCQKMLRDGKTVDDVREYLQRLVFDGLTGVDRVLELPVAWHLKG